MDVVQKQLDSDMDYITSCGVHDVMRDIVSSLLIERPEKSNLISFIKLWATKREIVNEGDVKTATEQQQQVDNLSKHSTNEVPVDDVKSSGPLQTNGHQSELSPDIDNSREGGNQKPEKEQEEESDQKELRNDESNKLQSYESNSPDGEQSASPHQISESQTTPPEKTDTGNTVEENTTTGNNATENVVTGDATENTSAENAAISNNATEIADISDPVTENTTGNTTTENTEAPHVEEVSPQEINTTRQSDQEGS